MNNHFPREIDSYLDRDDRDKELDNDRYDELRQDAENDKLATYYYELADAMIAERGKP
jgi:hypothetical protein